jgi:hypothetical protein
MLSLTPDSYHRSKHRGSTQLAPKFATSEYSAGAALPHYWVMRSIALHTDELHDSPPCSESPCFVLFRGPNADQGAEFWTGHIAGYGRARWATFYPISSVSPALQVLSKNDCDGK